MLNANAHIHVHATEIAGPARNITTKMVHQQIAGKLTM